MTFDEIQKKLDNYIKTNGTVPTIIVVNPNSQIAAFLGFNGVPIEKDSNCPLGEVFFEKDWLNKLTKTPVTQNIGCEVVENMALNKKFFYCRQHKKECEERGCKSEPSKAIEIAGIIKALKDWSHMGVDPTPISTATLNCATGVWTIKGKGYWNYYIDTSRSVIDRLTFSFTPVPGLQWFEIKDDYTYEVALCPYLRGNSLSIMEVKP